jgi:hypothetical protein
MKFWKFLLFCLILIFGSVLAFYLLGIVLNLLGYVFIGGLVLLAGVVGYKLLFGSKTKQIEEKDFNELDLAEQDLAKADRLLSDYKRKLLTEKNKTK